MKIRAQPKPKSCDADSARAQFSDLLEQAQRGITTIITRHGKALAALVPLAASDDSPRLLLASVKGSGAGLWSTHVHDAVGSIRNE